MTNSTPDRPLQRLRLTGADCFVLALNRLMRKNGQNELVGQTFVLLASEPEMDSLQSAANRLAKAHPILDAEVVRHPLSLLSAWKWKTKSRALPVRLWREPGVAGHEDAMGVESLHAWSEAVMNDRLEKNGGLRNLRIDLVFCRDGRSALVLTWSHLLFDGRGAELLVGELLRGSEKKLLPAPKPPSQKFRARIEIARPVVERFFSLSRNQYRSLAGHVPRPGKLRYELLRLDESQTDFALRRASTLANPLFPTAFFIACATRAHRRVFQSRGEDPSDYVMSIPVQTRRRGAGGAIFQNGVTMLFFHLRKTELDTLQAATQAAMTQFEEMTRQQLDRSFHQVLDLMKRLPSPLYMRFVGMQFQGEITSFFHSFTGEFSVPLDEVFGARVMDAFHVPSVSAPPGSGIFVGLFRGRLTATLSWRDGAATEKEISLMREHLMGDFTGEGVK